MINNLKAISPAVFAASFLVSFTVFQATNSHVLDEAGSDEVQVTMSMNSLDLQPLFSHRMED